MRLLLPNDTEKTEPVVSEVVEKPLRDQAPPLRSSEGKSSLSMRNVWLVIVAFLVISALGTGIYLLDDNHGDDTLLVSSLLTPTPNIMNPDEVSGTVEDPTSTWKTYNNTQNGFSIKYPANYKAPGDTSDKTLTFSSPGGNYTITVFPFSGSLEDLFEERTTNIVSRDSHIPVVYPDIPKNVLRTALVDGNKAYWYELLFEDSSAGREIHLLTENTGYIFRAEPKVVLNEREMELMIMSFTSTPVSSPSAATATGSGALQE